MYASINMFARDWSHETTLTRRLLEAMTDVSLEQRVSREGRTLGQIAWHMVIDIPLFLRHFGLVMDEVPESHIVPSSAHKITDTFASVSTIASEQIKEQWSDETLVQVQDAFGRMLPNGAILGLIVKHTIHHRGQMTVLMRQAGLRVPGMYGPAKEEWSKLRQVPPLY